MSSEQDLVVLGIVAKPHGIRGGLKVALYNPRSTLLAEQDVLWLRHGEQIRKVPVTHAQQQKGVVLLQLAGCDTRTAAEAYRDMEVCLPRQLLPALEEGEYYHRDLIGLAAYSDDGGVVGEIVDVLDYPSVSCLQVRGKDGLREIPLLDDYVIDVNVAKKRVTVRDWKQFEVIGA